MNLNIDNIHQQERETEYIQTTQQQSRESGETSGVVSKLMQTDAYENQQGIKYSQTTVRSGSLSELMQPIKYENKQGMEYIQPKVKSGVNFEKPKWINSIQLQKDYRYQNIGNYQPRKGSISTLSEVLQAHGDKDQQGTEYKNEQEVESIGEGTGSHEPPYNKLSEKEMDLLIKNLESYKLHKKPQTYDTQTWNNDYIREPKRSYPNELLPEHESNNIQLGMEHIREPSRSYGRPEVLPAAHEYTKQQEGYGYIQGPSRSYGQPEVLTAAHDYMKQQEGYGYIRDPSRSYGRKGAGNI